jgi:phosphatidate cytidylyltransferase
MGWGLAILFGLVLSVAAIVGDLIESLLKRDAQVKDAGAMLPGWAACSTGSTPRCSRFP